MFKSITLSIVPTSQRCFYPTTYVHRPREQILYLTHTPPTFTEILGQLLKKKIKHP